MKATALEQQTEPGMDSGHISSLTPEWRAEALFRLYSGVTIASRDSGTPLRDCWVPAEAKNPSTGEILVERNTYQRVRIGGQDVQAHVAMLILIHNRWPIRNADVDVDEEGMHLCNNPACRNPVHLKFGTRKQNSDYRVACGRAPSGPANGHATMPERTPRGEGHYRSVLRDEQREIAIALVRKYRHARNAARVIAEHTGTTVHVIRGLLRKAAAGHLETSIPDTDIELHIPKWKSRRGASKVLKNGPDEGGQTVAEIRSRFHGAAIHERSGLLLCFEKEYGFTSAWIRKILKRAVYSDVAPEIPVPTDWGIGRRRSFKRNASR